MIDSHQGGDAQSGVGDECQKHCVSENCVSENCVSENCIQDYLVLILQGIKPVESVGLRNSEPTRCTGGRNIVDSAFKATSIQWKA